MSFLEIMHAEKYYGNNMIFSDINIHINKGEFTTLLGPSGCGKSTLLRCLAGLSALNQGNIILNQNNITQLTPQKRNIAMVFQSYALFPNMTVFQNIAFGLKMKTIPKSKIKQEVDEMLELVELEDFAHRYPDQLSGGQRQRTALARSLIVKPDLLLLDEPLSALDARIRKHLRTQLRNIQQKLNMTTIFVTHDQEEALIMSDKVLLMNQGKIEQSNTPDKMYLSPANTFVAGFIGNYNILSRLELKELLAIHINNEHVAIRPEVIQLSRQENLPQAIITKKILLGNIIRYQLKAKENIMIHVDILNNDKHSLFQEGETVGLSISQQNIHILN